MDGSRAWNYCLWLLGRRAYSEEELRERLLRKEATPEVAESVLQRLRNYGFVDDEAFTSQFVGFRAKRYGSLRLRGELLRKGVDEELVEAELARLTEAEQEEVALGLLNRNTWRFTRSADQRRDRARAWAFLARRGFPPPAVSAAVERFEAGLPPRPENDADGHDSS